MNKTYIGLVDNANICGDYDKYVWAGDWCDCAIRKCKKNGYLMHCLDNTWSYEKERQREITEYLLELKESLIRILSKELNYYHNTELSDKSWGIYCSAWLTTFISTYYVKYRVIDSMLRSGITGDVHISRSNSWKTPCDLMEYNMQAYSKDYIMAQYKAVINEFDKNGSLQMVYDAEDICNSDEKISVTVNARRSISSKLLSVIAWLATKVDCQSTVMLSNSLTGFSLPFMIRVWIQSAGCILPLDTEAAHYAKSIRREIESVIPDIMWRSKPLNYECDDAFEQFLLSVLKKEIPISFVEGYKIIYDSVMKSTHNTNVKCIVHASGYASQNEQFRLMLSIASNRGRKLIDIQHGGNYGIEEYWLHKDEYNYSDVFYSWGWKEISDHACVVKPMPSLSLGKYTGFKKNKNSNAILMVTYHNQKYYFSPGRGMNSTKKNLDKQLLFLQGLSEGIKRRLIVRPLPEREWMIKEDIIKFIPDVRIDTESSLIKALGNAEMAIVTDWQNAVSEVLSTGIPFIVLREPFFVEKTAQSDYEELKCVGVICESWTELGIQVERIADKVIEWWNDRKRQEVISRMRRKYAWIKKDGGRLWNRELMGYLDR